MKFNSDPSFVGIEELKKIHARQVADFERWAAAGDWERFHASHYDWWAFPISRHSAYGMKYVVFEGEIAELKQDPVFVEKYLAGVRLVAASWGWDLLGCRYIEHPQPGQSWHHWPVRLFKAAQSVRLFGYEDYFASLKIFALDLIQMGEKMEYNGWDLSWLFTGPAG